MSPDCYLMKSIFWMRWKSYDSEIWTDLAEIVTNDLLIEGVQVAQAKEEPWSYGKDVWMHICRGSTSLAEYNALLAL